MISGLGPAGSALAIRLARAGLDVLAVDRASFPREKVCSEYMSPETVRHLEWLGVLPAIEARGAARLAGVDVIGPRGARLEGRFAAVTGADRASGLSISRRVLDLALVDEARRSGARIVERCRVRSLSYERGAVSGAWLEQRRGARAVRARLVVGADGLHSTIARLIGARRHGSPSRTAFVAHVAGVQDVGDVAELHVGPRGYVGLNRIENGLTNVAVVVPTRDAAAARGDLLGFWHDRLQSLPTTRDRVGPNAIARAVMATGPFAAWSSRVVADGALLVGDAADFFDPFTGEGICSALEGAELAARTIVRALRAPGIAAATALDGYRLARRRRYLGKWAVERLIGYGMLAPRLFDRAMARLERRGLSHTLVGVTGHLLPAREVLRPGFLAHLVI
ncbi:MAG: FAD-dependent monooxygenase [Gemmatimonadales bacterium]